MEELFKEGIKEGKSLDDMVFAYLVGIHSKDNVNYC